MSELAVKINGLGKIYKLFKRPGDKILDAFGMLRWLPWKKNAYREFWALRGLNLELGKGERLGIIGPNGAGKSTLLKIISGNIPSSRGTVEVNGSIQALMELGTGFHPEFTGYENIRASLSYQGFSSDEIKDAEAEIAEFTELGPFLTQPFKTYSSGMQARLAFATATVFEPEILIIDEVLGAGDAYFFRKSTERMLQMAENGASILLVSHALDQITRFCEKTIWLDRGHIVMQGESIEVVKAYEQSVRIATDRRLKAKNYKRLSSRYGKEKYNIYSDYIFLNFIIEGERGDTCDISEIRLLKNGLVEERLMLGDAQDTNAFHSAFVVIDEGKWSSPREDKNGYYRSLSIDSTFASSVFGKAAFLFHAIFENAEYALEIDYRFSKSGRLSLEIWKNGVTLIHKSDLPADRLDWTTQHIPLKSLTIDDDWPDRATDIKSTEPQKRKIDHRRWPSEGSLTIENVMILDSDGCEQTVFHAGSELCVEVTIRAEKSGTYEVLPTITIYRLDGICVTNIYDKKFSIRFEENLTRSIRLVLNPLNLGHGNYVFSLGLFRSAIDESQRYDLYDRSYEFQVLGRVEPNTVQGIFQHPGEWNLISVSDDKSN